MSIEVLEVSNKKDLKRWVTFPHSHYRGDPQFVPQLIGDELSYFNRDKNPAFEVAQARFFLALDQGRPVGRICGIINSLECEKLGERVGRFGWFDSIDDPKVAHLLLDTVREWLEAEDCIRMTGPHGFSDLDPGGILLDGFDQQPTIAGSYNYPYYPQLMDSYGLEKDVDYVEFRAAVPEKMRFVDRMRRALEKDSGGYHLKPAKNRKELLSKANDVWEVLEESFASLYGVVPLTKAQRDYYTKKYFGFLDPDFVMLGYGPDDEFLGFFIGIPSLGRAFQKAGGKLFPFGFIHILRTLRKPDTVDFMLAGSRPGLSPGVLSAIGFIGMYDVLRMRGVQFIETNRELETNTAVNKLWSRFEILNERHTRIYKMSLNKMSLERS